MFRKWLKKINKLLKHQTGLGVKGFPDIDYREHFNSGLSAFLVVEMIIDYNLGEILAFSQSDVPF